MSKIADRKKSRDKITHWENKKGVGRSSGKYDNLPTIQIITYIEETLSEYYTKVNREVIDLLEILDTDLDFSIHCPICGGSGCAQFIGYYEREVIAEDGRYYNRFPIARYKCRGKGNNTKISHKTFSLLPYQLVPYTKYSIPFIIKTLELRHIEGRSIFQIHDYLACFGEEEILSIGSNQLWEFTKIVIESVERIFALGYYTGIKCNSQDYEEQLKIFIEFAQAFEPQKCSPPIRGPCALSYDFYLNGGSYFKNAYFLFGTPSQFR